MRKNESLPLSPAHSPATHVCYDETKQTISVAAITLVLVAGVKGWIKVLESRFPMFSSGQTTSFVPALLGALYVFLGVLHFPMMKDNCNIVPDRWGGGLSWLVGVYLGAVYLLLGFGSRSMLSVC